VLFTRQPDYFDSEQAKGTIVQHDKKLVAQFSDGRSMHFAEVPYPFMHHIGEEVKVIYETSDPSKAKQYSVLGYWITFGELMASLFVVAALYWIATSITKNPTPEALLEELAASKRKPRKPKYDL
jgi:hypothetical protein